MKKRQKTRAEEVPMLHALHNCIYVIIQRINKHIQTPPSAPAASPIPQPLASKTQLQIKWHVPEVFITGDILNANIDFPFLHPPLTQNIVLCPKQLELVWHL